MLPSGRPLEGRSGKLERLVELLEAVPADDKALVFTQYPGFDRLARTSRTGSAVPVGFFHGGLSAGAQELLTRFDDDAGPRVSSSLRAGGRGLNLPAANHVLHFDRWWNPAVEQQAIRPRPPARPAQARVRLEPHLHGNGRGADRRALESKRSSPSRSSPRPRTISARRASTSTPSAAVALAPEATEAAA